MPEIPEADERNIKDIIGGRNLEEELELVPRRWFIGTEYQYLGKGRTCAVFRKKDTPNKVVSIKYEKHDSIKARKTFYIHRVFSTLFPDNFPHFYIVISPKGDYKNRVSSVRETIVGEEKDFWKFLNGDGKQVMEPMKDIELFCERYSVPVSFDTAAFNLLITKDNKEYYIDTIDDFPNKTWPINEILAYMDGATRKDGIPVYSRREKRVVEKSIKRIEELNKQLKPKAKG